MPNQLTPEDNFIPYGKEWEKELNKLPKHFLIGMIRTANLKRKSEEEKAKALLEALEEIAVDKYPENKFKPIPDDQWDEIASYIERKYSLDAISAHYGRIFHKMHREIAETTINNYKNSKQ